MTAWLMLLGLTLLAMWWVPLLGRWFPLSFEFEERVYVAEVLRQHQSGLIAESQSAGLVVGAPPGWRYFLQLPVKNSADLFQMASVLLVAGVSATVLEDPLRAGSWMLLGWGLLVLSIIDLRTRLLPDALTLPLLWLGLLLQLVPETASIGLSTAVLGAVSGYLPLWIFSLVYQMVRKRPGIGGGDLKLLAVMGAWSGPQLLPLVLLIAAILGIVIYVVEQYVLGREVDLQQERPFGPCLIAGYVLALLSPAIWLSS